ncbi:MAG: NAD(+) synthase [Bifidobacteriaceae bacterium]|jgi:NAD+ synthase (glutamine-hydrolysing)|nr:NAD(+) synthase [Bifidobacteriaceae bacterium]
MQLSAAAAGYLRVAACSFPVKLAQPQANAQTVADRAASAAAQGAQLAVFPELCLTGYSLDDLFMQQLVLDQVKAALTDLAQAARDLPLALVVGAPLRGTHRLYNCAVVVAGGEILGAVPKSYLPNYREFYEHRQFASGVGVEEAAQVGPHQVQISDRLLFDLTYGPEMTFTLGVEVCEDLWVPISPGAEAALAGAEVIANLSGSPITVAKARERARLCEVQSSKLLAGYVYAAAGAGESSTDLSWDGQTLVFERGEALAEGARFVDGPVTTLADVDLALIRQDRLRQGSFDDNRLAFADRIDDFLRVAATLPATPAAVGTPGTLYRRLARFPFVPDDAARLDQDCYEAYNIQVSGLVQRMRAIGQPKIVIGVSGGLDSTHALIVAAKAMDTQGRPRADILAYTMPGFATSDHTKANATALATALGVTFEELDIKPAAEQMLAGLRHPYAAGQPVYDVTFENVQAGLRTDYLFRLANHHGGIVLGTGDLSELALGWCTYGVGDQMSHYNVNCGVPKTLIQHLIRWVIRTGQFDAAVGQVLQSIVDTEISPELVPAGADGSLQSTQSQIGPYPLQDFTLYYVLRYGLTPRQILFRLHQAWGDAAAGEWPDGVPDGDRRGYPLAELVKWLGVFCDRFFSAQFKRSAVPNGPKVVRGGALSPRGDWRQPSDAMGELWRAELAALRDELG